MRAQKIAAVARLEHVTLRGKQRGKKKSLVVSPTQFVTIELTSMRTSMSGGVNDFVKMSTKKVTLPKKKKRPSWW